MLKTFRADFGIDVVVLSVYFPLTIYRSKAGIAIDVSINLNTVDGSLAYQNICATHFVFKLQFQFHYHQKTILSSLYACGLSVCMCVFIRVFVCT